MRRASFLLLTALCWPPACAPRTAPSSHLRPDEAPGAAERFEQEATDDDALARSFDADVRSEGNLSGAPVPRQEDTLLPPVPKVAAGPSAEAYEQAILSRDFKKAFKLASVWLSTCGPEGFVPCRHRAMSALEKAAAGARPAAKHRRTVAQLQDAERCVVKVERAPRQKALPACWASSEKSLRSFGDLPMLARMQLAHGRWAAQAPSLRKEALSRWARVEKECPLENCRLFREEARLLRAEALLEEKDWEAAAAELFRAVALRAESLPSPHRPLSRTTGMERLCQQLDAGAGAGSCRKWERRFLRWPSFYDFSKEARKGDLSPADILRVNEHFGPMLEECLAAQAHRLPEGKTETYQLQWMIGADGRVRTFQLKRAPPSTSSLDECLRQQFSLWRYPRSAGENQHVEQAFTVSSKAARDAPLSSRREHP